MKPVRVGVISDTHLSHLSDELLSVCRAHFENVDLILHAGDIVGPQVLEELEVHGFEVQAVRGNMDVHPGLGNLPLTRTLELGGVTVGVCHGAGSAGSVRRKLIQAFAGKLPQVVVYGHTHDAADTVEGGVRFVNPGSPTDRRFARFRSVGMLTLEAGRADFRIIRLKD